MARTIDMTEGRPLGLIARFAIPAALGNIFNIAYTIVDGIIVGWVLGVNAFASIGASWFLYWIALSSILGLTQGFGTVFAQRFGSKDISGLRAAFANAIFLSAGIGIAISLPGVLICGPALMWLNTPSAILSDAEAYLRVLFGGMLITFAYILLCSMLRALGDSKTPLYALILSTLLNIILDIVLVTGAHMGVAGVAGATLIAQLAACVYCIAGFRKVRDLMPARSDFKWDSASSRELLRLGLPAAFSDSVCSLGGLVTQYIANGYGVAFVAGVAAAKRIYSLLEIVGGAMEGAMAAFVAQNFGAGLFDRVRSGIRIGRILLLVSALIITAFALLSGRWLVGLFIPGEAEQIAAALDAGQIQLSVMAVGLPALYLLFLYRCSLQAIGRPLMPMLSGFVEMGAQIASALFLTLFLNEWGVYLSGALGWVFAAIQLYVAYVFVFKKRLNIT